MRIPISGNSSTPLYRQIADDIARRIGNGSLAQGVRLPTVNSLAEQLGTSRGTAKRAYDELEHVGLISKVQGRGTFVRTGGGDSLPPPPPDPFPQGRKDKALAAIEHLLDELETLSFSPREARILLELKLREREDTYRNVSIAAVDCSPEALAEIRRQLSALSHVDVQEYNLDQVLEAPGPFMPGTDLCVTTSTHFAALREKMPQDRPPLRMALSVSQGTVLRLAKIPAAARVAVICASARFSQLILRACQRYAALHAAPRVAFFGDPVAVLDACGTCDVLILPPDYQEFASQAEQEAIRRQSMEDSARIVYRYRIDKGSLLHLEEQVHKLLEQYEQ